MTRDEATALFDRVYQQLSSVWKTWKAHRQNKRQNERLISILMHRYEVSREFAQAAIDTYDATAHISVEAWQQGKAALAHRYPEEYTRWMPPQHQQ